MVSILIISSERVKIVVVFIDQWRAVRASKVFGASPRLGQTSRICKLRNISTSSSNHLNFTSRPLLFLYSKIASKQATYPEILKVA